MNNNIFNVERFGYLLLRQIQLSSKGLLIGAGGFIGFSIFILFMPMLSPDYHFSSTVFFGSLLPMIVLGGYIATSLSFAELNTPQKSYLYLTLPASATEKLAVAWLSSSLIYLIFAIVVLFVINLLLLIIDTIGLSRGVSLVNLFDNNALLVYANYLVTQTIFLLGAIYFRKLNFLRTVLALIIVGFAIALYCGLLVGLVSLLHDGHLHGRFVHLNIDNKDAIGQVISTISKVLYWGITAPFFLIVSYFTLKERQV